MSCITATLRSADFAASRTRRVFLRCPSCSPWEKFKRVTSTPKRTTSWIASSVEVAGPRVATIFVRRSIPLCPPPPGVERDPTRVVACAPEDVLDPEKLIVLRHALAARRRPGLDLSGVHRDREVRDRRVLGLPAAVADHGRIAGLVRQVHRLEGLRERP